MYILSALNRRSAFQTRLSDIRDAIINNALFFPPAALFPLGHGRPRNICGREMKAWQPVAALVCLARGPPHPRWAQWIDNLTEWLLVLAKTVVYWKHTLMNSARGEKNKNNNNDRRIQPLCWSSHPCLYVWITQSAHVSFEKRIRFFNRSFETPQPETQPETHTQETHLAVRGQLLFPPTRSDESTCRCSAAWKYCAPRRDCVLFNRCFSF